MEVNYLAIVAAAVASFVISSVWYAVFDRQRTELLGGADAAAGGRPPAWKVLVELFRSLVVASVLAGLAARMEITDWTGAALLGSAAWIGFPFVLLTGSVIWDNAPWKLAAVHAGDWLVKLLVITVMVSVWH
ncbi:MULTISPECIES: DUF1761 domain-containing protein [Streptosporangium]|uniref:DUF1761 domain-containing protein n=1 Tax=Streptosporangium brasiliense TaxID=47480 RepID=A0ABT9R903_9ACTN|nr:DUF1761 domain-containing protein [Streptosporangium brasiliense]MDP9865712.1 hypothetical protein [Streptosporangium brasiliense]